MEIQGARDVRMLEKAVREGWDIPEELYRILPRHLAAMIADKSKSDRARLSAVRAVIQMHGQNQASNPATQTHLHAHLAIEHDETWYGNDAHARIDHAPEAAAPPATDPD